MRLKSKKCMYSNYKMSYYTYTLDRIEETWRINYLTEIKKESNPSRKNAYTMNLEHIFTNRIEDIFYFLCQSYLENLFENTTKKEPLYIVPIGDIFMEENKKRMIQQYKTKIMNIMNISEEQLSENIDTQLKSHIGSLVEVYDNIDRYINPYVNKYNISRHLLFTDRQLSLSFMKQLKLFDPSTYELHNFIESNPSKNTNTDQTHPQTHPQTPNYVGANSELIKFFNQNNYETLENNKDLEKPNVNHTSKPEDTLKHQIEQIKSKLNLLKDFMTAFKCATHDTSIDDIPDIININDNNENQQKVSLITDYNGYKETNHIFTDHECFKKINNEFLTMFTTYNEVANNYDLNNYEENYKNTIEPIMTRNNARTFQDMTHNLNNHIANIMEINSNNSDNLSSSNLHFFNRSLYESSIPNNQTKELLVVYNNIMNTAVIVEVNRIKYNNLNTLLQTPLIHRLFNMNTYEFITTNKSINVFKTLVNNTIYESFKCVCEEIDNLNNSDSITDQFIEEFIKNNYSIDTDRKHKVKYTTFYEELLSTIEKQNIKISSENKSEIKYKLSGILAGLGLKKFRASDGIYWYGISNKNKYINNPYSIRSSLIDAVSQERETLYEYNG